MPARRASQTEKSDIGQLARKLEQILKKYWSLTTVDRDKLYNTCGEALRELYDTLNPLLQSPSKREKAMQQLQAGTASPQKTPQPHWQEEQKDREYNDIGELADTITQLLKAYWKSSSDDRERLVNKHGDVLVDLWGTLIPLVSQSQSEREQLLELNKSSAFLSEVVSDEINRTKQRPQQRKRRNRTVENQR